MCCLPLFCFCPYSFLYSTSRHSYLRKNTMIRWMAIKRWCVQILTGLAFLHENHIIHRDIKCDNIFINGSTGDIRIGTFCPCFLA